MSETMAGMPNPNQDPTQVRALNNDFDWDEFDSDAYFQAQLPGTPRR